MPLFKCEKCGCVENTALGLYWTRHWVDNFDYSEVGEEYKGRALCSECAPKRYSDGTPTKYGKWHGKFPKEQWDDNKFEHTNL